MTKMTLGILGATVCLLTLGNTANAVLLSYDGFDYTAGQSLVGQNGGTGWSNAWTGRLTDTISATGLTYADLATTGNAFISTNGFDGGVFRVPSFTEYNTGTGTLWGSFLIQAATPANNNGFTGLSFFNNGGDGPIIGKLFNTAGIRANVFGTADSNVAFSGNVQLLLYRFSATGDGNSDFNLWVDPALSAGEAGLGTPDIATTGGSVTFDEIRFANGGGGNFTYDEVRFGTTFADAAPALAVAVPEAGTLGLLALVGAPVLGALALRRRK